MSSPEIFCGVDLGSQKTVVVASDGERILTSTGGTSRPTAVSFYDRSRLLGEEAIPQMMSENTVTFLSTLLGASYREVMDRSQSNDDCFGFIPHTRMTLVPLGGSCADHSDSVVGLRVAYTGPDADSESQDQGTVFSVPALLGMYFTSLVEQVRSSYGEHNGHKDTNRFVLSFPLPHGHSPEAVRALKEACAIAGIAPSLAPITSTPNGVPSTSMFITTTTESLARAYARKLSGLKPKEKTHLENGGKVLLVDMGCMQSTVMVLAVQPDLTSANVMACDSCASLGGFHFDLAIFHHLVKICEDKHKLKIVPGTKAALRFLTACERLRKLLSQLHEASVTIENLSDEVGDLTFTLRREELSSLCAPIMTRFKGLISNTLAAAGVGEAGGLAAVEVLGGGVRMQIIHEAILEFAGDLPLGAKLDDGSVAVGAALKAVPPPVLSVDEIAAKMTVSEEVDSVTETDNNTMKQDMKQDNSSNEEEVEARWGLSEEDLSAAVTAEKRMRVQDAEILRLLECRNEMEAYIFEMRGCSSQKHGDLIADPDALRATCDEFENWLWDFGETASLQEVVDKFSDLKEKLEGPEVGVEEPSTEGDVVVVVKRRQGGLCSEYLSVVAQDKAAVEKSLAEEAAQAAQEHEGEDKDDHDFRKLRKPERMRLVMKNKEEGTELFKGGNVRPAAARYQKALTHAAKFFDLSPEDTEEVNTVKLSLHLNLTQCYLKLENWDNATRHADEALAIDEQSVKALFRRAQAWEARKDYDKALADMKRAVELNAPKEDKLITKGMDRVKKLIQKEKDKEKKMWGKAFS